MGRWLSWRGVLLVNEHPPHLGFWCPACDTLHLFDERWKFNGDYECPTFEPSLRISTGHHVPGVQMRPDGKCEICESAKERGVPTTCSVCHLNITAGQLFYHGDCTHAMRGAVPMGVCIDRS